MKHVLDKRESGMKGTGAVVFSNIRKQGWTNPQAIQEPMWWRKMNTKLKKYKGYKEYWTLGVHRSDEKACVCKRRGDKEYTILDADGQKQGTHDDLDEAMTLATVYISATIK